MVKHISAIILGMIFLISSSGFLMYKSHCTCTGNEQVTVFVKSEICESESSKESDAEMSCCSTKEIANLVEEEGPSCCSLKESISCESQSNGCDCDNTEVTYLKLKNQVVKEDVKFTRIEPIELAVLFTALSLEFFDIDHFTELKRPYVDPPPIHSKSLDFLIQIQQLKIPYIT